MIDAYRTWSARTGQTRADLARLMGVSYSVLGRWLHGARMPRPARLRALADALGADPVELLRQLDARKANVLARESARP